MKKRIWSTVLCLICATQLVAEPLKFRQARNALPKASADVAMQGYPDRVPAADAEKLAAANQTVDVLLASMGAALTWYGAVAISPDEGMFVDWLSGTGQHHSADAARVAALAYCDEKRQPDSAPCVVILEAGPEGAKPTAKLTLSAAANAALRSEYRKLSRPRAFAISAQTGDFGFARGNGSQALAACAAEDNGAKDCKVVVAD